MRKFLLTALILMLFGVSFGQLTGIRSIPGSGGPNDYPTIASAIADLNLLGVGPGGVTFNVAAGYTETFQTADAGLITATGFDGSPIVFQKSGTGANPLVTAGTGTSASNDGIIRIAGGDYFTFDGIDLTEAAANTNATAQMEWGYALLKASATIPVNGCQYITIKNSTITLNNLNTNSSGIYSGNHTATTSSIPVAMVIGPADLHNNCGYFGNTISNVCYGFRLSDVPDPEQVLFDKNNQVGALNAGNSISNLGSSNNQTFGIYVHNQDNISIAYNTITGNANTSSNFTGITTRTSNRADIHHNLISVNYNGTGSVYAIDLQATGKPGLISNIYENILQNSVINGSGSFTGISGGNGSMNVMNINSNIISGNTVSTGSMTLIIAGAAQTNNIYGNQIFNNMKTGAGNLYGIRGLYFGNNIHDNQVYSNKVISGLASSASIVMGINSSTNAQTSENIYNNLIYDLVIEGPFTTTNNQVYGMNLAIPATANRSVYNNVVRDLAVNLPSGSGTVNAIRAGDGNVSNIYKNQIYNLTASGAAGQAIGIYTSGTVQGNVYNNFISDLRAPASANASAVNGIQVASGTRAGLFYNTLYLNASGSAATFGSSGIYKTGASTLLDLRNNIVINASVPGASGLSVAFRANAAYNATYHAATSNANNFYAGAPDASHLIYYDGVNSDMTMAGFQTRVAPRDALSFSENSPLINTSSAPYDLHMSTSVPTFCEAAAVPVTSPAINDDFDGNPRSATPDVGAHEFAGIANGVINPSAVAAAMINSRQVNIAFTANPSNDMVVIVWNNTGYFSAPSGTPPAVNGAFAGGTLLYKGTASPVAHTGLSGGTTYFYKAFSFNGSAYSSGVPVQANTSLAPPLPFTGYAIAFDRIDLAWTPNAQNNEVVVAVSNSAAFGQPVNGTSYTAGSALPVAGTVIYTGPLSAFSHTGLTANTTYYYKIWSADAFAYYSATGTAINVTTMLCAPTSTLPFNEGFEAYAPPAIGCGITIDGNGDGTTWISGTVNPHSGTKSISCLTSASSNSDDWYFIQGLNLTAGVTYQLSFWFRPQATYPTVKFEVKWGTTPTPSGMYPTPLYSYATGSVVGMTQATCLVTPATSGAYYFGWHHTSDIYQWGSTRISVDDIAVETNPCPAPPSAAVSAITPTSAEVAWTGGAANVQIDYGTFGHAPGTGTLVNTSANPHTLNGLTPKTKYDVYVRQDCGMASYSFWAGPYTFTTTYLNPEVTTEPASALTGSGATLNGTVNANGVATSAYFEYGLSDAYGNMVTATPATISSTGSTPVAATIANLVPNGATYHYRAVAYSGGVYTYGADMTFVTSLAAPVVTTLPATSLSSSGATLNARVNAGNSDAAVTFEYGPDASYGTTVTAVPSPVTGALPVNVSAAITGLTPGMTYHYRVNAVNAAGNTNGADLTFTAANLPSVTTTAPVAVANTTATLTGLVNPNDYTTTVTFRYGTTSAYGTTVTPPESPVSGNTTTPVTFALTGLAMNTTYHYQAVGVNAAGTVYGENMTFTTGTIPTVTTNAATQNSSGVTMSGTFSANNAPTSAFFEYGTSTAYGTVVPYQFNPFTNQNRTITSVISSGLMPATTYNYRAYATNAGGTTYGANMTFTTPVAATVTTVAATPVGTTTATLKGTVNPNGVPTAYRFDYGLTTAYGSTTSPSPSSGSGTSTVSLSKAITGLQPNTTYNYRMVGTNAGGPYYGENMTFTTGPVVPVVNTLTVTGLAPNAAMLNGTVNPNFAATETGFEYGESIAYGNTVPAAQGTINGGILTGTSALIAGLAPNTLYHYRATGTNAAGPAYGTDMTFTTLAMLPEVITLAATQVGTGTAVLNGSVNAFNASTAVSFEYGPTAEYGNVATASPATVNGNIATGVTLALAGLAPNTTYHFRLIGTNAAGTGFGPDMTFTTPVSPLSFTATPVDPVCYGGTGSVILGVPQGGTPPYTFDPANPPVTGLAPGSYTYIVSDATGYQASSTAVINQGPSQLVLVATAIAHPACFGDQTGIVSLSVSGGTPGYTYDPMNPPLTGLAGGTYTYWVSDANGCQTSATVTINSAPVLIINNPGICFPGTVNLTAPSVTSGSILYGGTLSYWMDANATTPVSNPVSVGAGTYFIKASLSESCFDIMPVTATIHPLPQKFMVTGGGGYCAGTSGATVGLEGSETGISYTLENLNGQISGPVPGTGGPISFGPQTTTGMILVLAQNATTGCASFMSNSVNIWINQPLQASVTIAASANPSVTGQEVIFTATPVNGGYPTQYQWKVNGQNAGTGTPQYSYFPNDGDQVSCIMTSGLACVSGNPATSNTIGMTVINIPVNTEVAGTVSTGQVTCYNATGTITVAGNGTLFTVENGGSATMIAGQKIIYLPGTTVLAGGYMHGYISSNYQYCGQQAPSIPSTITGGEGQPAILEKPDFIIYPNPTNGNFTIEQKNETEIIGLRAEVYGMHGEKVLSSELSVGRKFEMPFNMVPAGLYFVKIIGSGYVETFKLIKL